VKDMMADMPEHVKIETHDLSHYTSLKEQFSTGVMDGYFQIKTNNPTGWH